MKFTQTMGLTSLQNGYDFFDLDVTKDTELFIDPYRLSKLKHSPHVSRIHSIVTTFVFDLLQLVRNNQRSKADDLCPRFSETKGTGIGYAKDKISGSGAGEALSTHLVDVMFASKAVTSNIVSNLEECAVVCEGIGKDRVSDIVLSVGKIGFIEFTQAQCRKHNIPMERTNKKLTYFCPLSKTWEADYFDLPHITNPNTNKIQYIILIPESILDNKVVYSPDYFIRHVLNPYFREDAIKRNVDGVQTRKNGDKYIANDDLFQYPEYCAKSKLDINNFVELHPEKFEQFRRINAPYRYEQLMAS